MERGNPLLDDYVLSLTGKERPRVCFLPTASGDADHYIVRFYRAFDAGRCEPSHVSLFRRDQSAEEMHRQVLTSDLVYVGGGSVISLLGTWRAHGLDVTLRRAWERGVVMCGLSAGSLCWFAEAVSAFHGPPSGSTGSACCRTATACTSTPSRSATSPTATCSRRGWARAMPWRTAPPFTSRASGSRGWSARARAPGPSGCSWSGESVSREPLAAEYLGAAPAVRAA